MTARHATATAPSSRGDGNDDRVLVDASRGLYAVADGIGGVRHGARSAQLVVDALPGLVDEHAGDLGAVLERVHEQLVALALRTVGGVGTTIVCAHLTPGVATIAHVGDSKAHLVRENGIEVLTVDHSLTATLGARAQDAATSGGRGMLTRYLGMPGAVRPDVRRVPVLPGDRLLLCSDGLVEAVPTAEILALLVACPLPDEACRRLLAAAGPDLRDDATVVVVEVS